MSSWVQIGLHLAETLSPCSERLLRDILMFRVRVVEARERLLEERGGGKGGVEVKRVARDGVDVSMEWNEGKAEIQGTKESEEVKLFKIT